MYPSKFAISIGTHGHQFRRHAVDSLGFLKRSIAIDPFASHATEDQSRRRLGSFGKGFAQCGHHGVDRVHKTFVGAVQHSHSAVDRNGGEQQDTLAVR